MKTLLRVTMAAGVLAVSGVALTPIFAQDGPAQGGSALRRMGPGGPGHGFGPGPGGPFGMLGEFGRGLRQLDLSEAQREQLRGVMDSHRAEFQALGDRMRTAHEALDAVVTADSVDESAIRARSADVAAVQADAAVLRGKVHQEIFSLLTAEQQAKAKELKAQAQARMKERASRLRERGNRPPQQG
jgi:Spy/CpxP family protein refolding chaperone